MLTYNVNYLPIISSAVVGFVLSFIWWGPIFGKTWSRLVGMTDKDMKKAKEKGMVVPMIVASIGSLLMAYVLSILLTSTGIATIGAALSLAFFVWLGFVAPIAIGSVLWENKPMSLFWLNSLGWLVVLLAMAVTIVMF